MTKVYIAGPMTKGCIRTNVRVALAAATELADAGFAPIVPHLSHFWDMMYPRPYEYWMKIDFEWLAACGALLRLPGESSGADREVAKAQELGIPVFYSVQELVNFFKE